MANATLGKVPNIVPRIKLSATSDLKEFHGKTKMRTEHAAGSSLKDLNQDGPRKTKNHAEHYIETSDNPEVASQLTVLRLANVEDLEDVLRSRQRTKARRGEMLLGSSKFHQKVPNHPDRQRKMNRQSVQTVKAVQEQSSSEDFILDNSDSGGELRKADLMETEAEKYRGRSLKVLLGPSSVDPRL
ncbi:unnamed protein product [Peronospora belbahrii]|uniref:Uncharacterized protein n=1 Tax=Peronospora belbahrii TaxID=622444 RepID=A0AAU9KVG2_9STRA|nr:unnamed protein product [Peronospora belbahrii]